MIAVCCGVNGASGLVGWWASVEPPHRVNHRTGNSEKEITTPCQPPHRVNHRNGNTEKETTAMGIPRDEPPHCNGNGASGLVWWGASVEPPHHANHRNGNSEKENAPPCQRPHRVNHHTVSNHHTVATTEKRWQSFHIVVREMRLPRSEQLAQRLQLLHSHVHNHCEVYLCSLLCGKNQLGPPRHILWTIVRGSTRQYI